MNMGTDLQYLCMAAAAGVASHVFYFIHGEYHIHAAYVLGSYALLVIGPYAYFLLGSSAAEHFSLTPGEVGLLQATYFASLFSSIAAYRLLFHRTRHFPGPKLAALTKLYHAGQVRDSKQHLWLDALHKKYGDYVRTGPNEITIFHPEAILPIHGPDSACAKTAWYDNLWPVVAVVTTRSRAEHDQRRRLWDYGYSIKALASYESTILQHAKLVEKAVGEHGDQPVNVTRWFEYFGFDAMGVIQYSQSFGMLERGSNHWVLDTFKKGTVILGYFSAIPWLIHILRVVQWVGDGKGMKNNNQWSVDSILQRIEKHDDLTKQQADKNVPGVNHVDVMGWLIDEAHAKEGGIKADWNWLIGDFLTMVTGGTEPVIAAIVFLFYHLVQEPRHAAAVRAEIATLTSYADTTQLNRLEHLTGCIYETFRLHPSIPSGGLRVTPKEGLVIGDRFIPGNTTVLTPQYTLARREDCFEQPEEFVPERWTTRPDMVRNKEAFMPWGVGPYMCVGKNLGLMEIRTLTVLLLDNFEISFAPNEDGTKLHENTLDCFATIPGDLWLQFKRRAPDAKITRV